MNDNGLLPSNGLEFGLCCCQPDEEFNSIINVDNYSTININPVTSIDIQIKMRK